MRCGCGDAAQIGQLRAAAERQAPMLGQIRKMVEEDRGPKL